VEIGKCMDPVTAGSDYNNIALNHIHDLKFKWFKNIGILLYMKSKIQAFTDCNGQSRSLGKYFGRSVFRGVVYNSNQMYRKLAREKDSIE